jgi:hypothetical protein
MHRKTKFFTLILTCLTSLFALRVVPATRPGGSEPLLEVHVVAKPITNSRFLPDTVPPPSKAGQPLMATACAGEYEPVSFTVRAVKDVKGLELTITDLKSEDGVHTIPSTAVDPYTVKCWYQGGRVIQFRNERLVTPELLLKDDSLVRVDIADKQNYLKTTDAAGKMSYVLISGKDSSGLENMSLRDAAQLQPVDIPAGALKQFWLTVHVPEDAKSAEYRGEVRLSKGDDEVYEIPLRLRVLPFKLERSILTYSIYYRGKLRADGTGSITSEWKSPIQYEAEMRDMKAHGVVYPTVYQGYNPDLLRQMFRIREQAELPKGPLYTLGMGTGSPTTAEQLDALKGGVRKWIEIASQHGYDPVYVYGIDEARGERLKAQQQAWEAVKEAGGKVFVACYKGTFEAMGDRLGLAVFAGRPDREEAKKYHRVGSRIFCYANPQVGVEEPETYRRNFGLLLWKAGYDGAMDYAYQHSFGHIWNDFDHGHYRDHVFAYPTADGVVDTIEWEGFREGVDDVRYLSTLLKAIEEARRSYNPDAAAAESWLEQLDPSGDLDRVRGEVINWILKLRSL